MVLLNLYKSGVFVNLSLRERNGIMKVKEGYILREVAQTWMVVPFGERVVEFNGIITLNQTGAFLWGKLEEDADEASLLKAMLEEFDVDAKTAKNDIDEFIASLRDGGLLEE